MDAVASSSRSGRLPQLAKYEVLEEIGHGGMATVYRAKDKRLGREIAVKIIHPHLRDTPEVVHRFSVEAKAVAMLKHPNIVEVFDVSGEDEEEQYLVVELLRGITLRKLLQQRAARGLEGRGPLPPEVAAAVAVELLEALAHAHESGVIHRDVKPENVILEHRPLASSPASDDRPGSRVAVKLTDFGIAKLLDAQGVTSTGQVLGSPAHMAPEQIEGGEVDARADVFGLGVLLYECMVGHLPFEGNNPAQVLRRVLEGAYPVAEAERDTIGKGWSALLDRALAHDPAARFSDANEMRLALCQELKRLGIETPKRELEAWLDDPDAYEESHAKRMVEALSRLGQDARKRGDALGAAADYNRALAYAPNDAALLKIVTSMHREETRARVLKKGAQAAGVMLLLGAAAFGVTRLLVPAAIAPDETPTRPTGSTSARPPASAVPSASAAPDLVESAQVSPTPSSEHPTHVTIPSMHPSAIAPPPKTMRTVTVITDPPNGVQVQIDGAGAVPISAGTQLSLDSGAHDFVFACVIPTACNTIPAHVEAGEEGTTLTVQITFKDATLIVHSKDPAARFFAKGVQLVPEVPAKFPMKTSPVPVVVEQIGGDEDARRSKSTQLKAGETVSVDF